MINFIGIIISFISVAISYVAYQRSQRLINNRSEMTKILFYNYCEIIRNEFCDFDSKCLSFNTELWLAAGLEPFKNNNEIFDSSLYKKKVIDIEKAYDDKIFECCKNGSKNDLDIFNDYLTIKELYSDIIFLILNTKSDKSEEEIKNKKKKLKNKLITIEEKKEA